MIPRILHCCWFGGPKTKLARKCRESWAKFAPDWQVREWNEENVQALRDLPGWKFLDAAIKARKWSAASDWVRMAALYREGGVYLDFDHELVASIDNLADEPWVASEWTVGGVTEVAAGAGLALESGSKIADYMLDRYEDLPLDHLDEMMPWIVARMEEAFRLFGRIRILPPEMMSPMDIRGRVHLTQATLGIHHYAMSWAAPRRRIARWLSWHGMRGLVDFILRMKGSLA